MTQRSTAEHVSHGTLNNDVRSSFLVRKIVNVIVGLCLLVALSFLRPTGSQLDDDANSGRAVSSSTCSSGSLGPQMAGQRGHPSVVHWGYCVCAQPPGKVPDCHVVTALDSPLPLISSLAPSSFLPRLVPSFAYSASFFLAQTVDERTVDRTVTKERISEGGKRARLEEPEFSTAPSESNNDRFSRHRAMLATHSVDHTVRRTVTGGRASREVKSAGVRAANFRHSRATRRIAAFHDVS